MSAQFKRLLRADRERFWGKVHEQLLLDLVSVSDDSCGRFRKRFPILVPGMNDSSILKFRDQLRKFWESEELTRFLWLECWVHEAHQSPLPSWNVVTYADGTHSIIPNSNLFPLSLAFAASELSPRMGICSNPDCPQTYFLKGRKTQRFCDWSICAAFGQRQHKLKWWDAHKEDLRTKRKNSEMRRKKTGRN
jgi:hypothetical protein